MRLRSPVLPHSYPPNCKQVILKLVKAKQMIRKAHSVAQTCGVDIAVKLTPMLEAVGGDEASDKHLFDDDEVRHCVFWLCGAVMVMVMRAGVSFPRGTP